MPYLAQNPTARGHERKCKALRYRARDPLTGERVRCGKYALRDGDLCAYHQKHSDRRGINADTIGQRTPLMPAAFSRHLSQTLRQRLAELEGRTPVELIDL